MTIDTKLLLTYLKNIKVNIVMIKQPNEKPPPILDTYRMATLKLARLNPFEIELAVVVPVMLPVALGF